MSNSKMLIDATHPEETRVVVVRGGRVEEFDYESAARKLLRGNIYLAKVTRVEPSLQAAFVDYGGNRHGFLAFNEIHPDYYQIPVADRQALIDEEAQAEAEEEAEADADAEARADSGQDDDAAGGDTTGSADRDRDDEGDEREAGRTAHHAQDGNGEDVRSEPVSRGGDSDDGEQGGVHEVDAGNGNGEAEVVEEVSTEQDALEEVPSRPRRRMRSYKIQEVIKRRQVVLVQVVKEERGSKGAALTTYLSLAGRYTVLMPNTARGGGISRKITNPGDRKRLKAIAHELEVPEGMGLIIRTAGAARTKQEIKRDFEYLLRLWESVRDLTLQSTAPSLVYEEGNLIKRSIRDHFTKDVDEVIVAGEAAHQDAFDFMRMLMPSHAKNVIAYQDHEPLFARFQVERQLNAMFSPFVTLRSGGYLVINQTEALVAVDINSGKSTREFSIEETALNTNLEAAEEIARQLKLRDLAGLIVIDFIDMEEKRNNRAVERRLKDALRFDRARIQIGRISHFGLLEMSRQRLRTGVLEGSTTQCPHCQGTGIVRSTESVALAVLRGIEDALMANPRGGVIASTTATVALYILNNKRIYINEMEQRYGITIVVQASDKLHGANFNIERTAAMAGQPQRRPERQAVNMDWGFEGEGEGEGEADSGVEEVEGEVEADIEDLGSGRDDDSSHIEVVSDDPDGEDGERRGRGRRRRRRGRRGDRPEGDHGSEPREAREARGDRPERGDRADRGGSRGDRRDRGGRGEPRGRPAHHHNGDRLVADDQPLGAGGTDTPIPLAAYANYAMQAADIAAGGEGIGEVRSPERFEDGHGEDGDRGGRRGRRRGRRGGRRGRDRDAPRFEGNGRHEHGNGHDGQPAHHEADAIAGQGPQPDLPDDLPIDFTTAEQRPPRRRERWRDRRRGGEGYNDRWTESAGGVSAAVMAAALAAGGSPVAESAPEPMGTALSAEEPPTPAAAADEGPVVQVAEVAAVVEPVKEPAPAPIAVEPAPVAASRVRRVSDPTASEPRIEHVVMRPDRPEDAAVEGSDQPTQAPTRKGWWQRGFGGA